VDSNKGLSHSDFIYSSILVQAIVHECDSPINRAPDQMNTIALVGLFPHVNGSQSNQGNPPSVLPRRPIANRLVPALPVGRRLSWMSVGQQHLLVGAALSAAIPIASVPGRGLNESSVSNISIVLSMLTEVSYLPVD
jgi:hypothetical protein